MQNNRPENSGFTLIELLIAMVLGLFLVLGIISLYSGISSVSIVQTGLARLQENGRFAAMRMTQDLRMIGSNFCTPYTDDYPSAGGRPRLRSTAVFVPAITSLPTPSGVEDPMILPGAPWRIHPRLSLQGHECDSGGVCTPLPADSGSGSPGVSGSDTTGVPAAGTAAGDRAMGTDVLTLRYLNNKGVIVGAVDNATSTITLNGAALVSDPPLSFDAGDRAMISDCRASLVFATNAAGNTLSATSGDGNQLSDGTGISLGSPSPYLQRFSSGVTSEARVWNFTKAFRTVTYYVGLKNDLNVPGRLISSLYRQENGISQELVEGVERFDVTYRVDAGAGNYRYLTADQVDSRAGGAIACPQNPQGIAAGTPVSGCLWAMVDEIEVSMLMNTVNDVSPSDNDAYRYTPDGSSYQYPSDGIPSTLPVGRMLRREFNFVANVRNQTY
ncbi:MAG: PilW family protein [bacterium]